MPLLSKASNVVQNIFFLYDVTGFTQIGHSIPVATNCIFKYREATQTGGGGNRSDRNFRASRTGI